MHKLSHKLTAHVLCALCILIACASQSASAQTIVRANILDIARERRAADNAADIQDYPAWPRVIKGEAGTAVHITLDPRNIDIILMTARRYRESRLIESSLKIAKLLSAPRVRLLTLVGLKTSNVDIEMNNYLQRERRGARYDLDADALRRGIAATDLPAPIVFFVDAKDINARIQQQAGSFRDISGKDRFFQLAELASWSALKMSASIPWWGPIAAAICVIVGLIVFVSVLVLPWRSIRKKPTTETPMSLEEAQSRYIKSRWTRKAVLIVPLLFFLVLMPAGRGEFQHFNAIVSWCLPELHETQWTLLGRILVVPLLLISALASRLYLHRRSRIATSDSPTGHESTDRMIWMSAGWIIAVAVGVAITLTAAHFNRADLARNYIIPVISPIFAVFICWPLFRFKARVLATDDPLGLQCIEMAERAGVKVKKVIVLKTKVANAGVTAFGVLFLTTTLLEKLDAAELRAIIAHELGHLRTGRVRRISAISLSFFIVMLAFSHLLQWLLARHARNPVATFHYWQFVPIAFLFLFMMAISPYRRRDEYMADAFALEMIGDPDLVIRAIKKVHALNQSPSKLTPEDEAISTHPSLVKRLDALRAKCPVNNESAGGTTAA